MAFGSEMHAAHRRSTGDLTLAAGGERVNSFTRKGGAGDSSERQGMGASERVLPRGASSPAISLCDIDGCPGCRGTRSQMGLPHYAPLPYAPLLPPLASVRSQSEGRLRHRGSLDCYATDGRDSALQRHGFPQHSAQSREETEDEEEAEEEGQEGVKGDSEGGAPWQGREQGAGHLMPLEELSVRGTSGAARLARGKGQKPEQRHQRAMGFQEKEHSLHWQGREQSQVHQSQAHQSQSRSQSQQSQSLHGQGREQSLHGLPLELSESIFQRLLHDMHEAATECHEARHARERGLRHSTGPRRTGDSPAAGESQEAHRGRLSGAAPPFPASLQAVYGHHRGEGVGTGIPYSVSLQGLPEELSESIHCRVLADLRGQEQGRHASGQSSCASLEGSSKADSSQETDVHGIWGFTGKKGWGHGGRDEGKEQDGAHCVATRCPGHKKGRLERIAFFCKMHWRSHHDESRMDFAH